MSESNPISKGTKPSEKESPIRPDEAMEVFKDLHMTGRAMRSDETPAEYKREREESWPIEWAKIQLERGWTTGENKDSVDKKTSVDISAIDHSEDENTSFVPIEKQEVSAKLSEMNQDEYSDWLSQNMPEESDLYNQIVVRPEFRSLTSKERADVFTAIKDSPEYAQYKIRVEELDQFWMAMNRLQGTGGVRTIGSGSSWNNFVINEGTVGHSDSKGYLTFKNPIKSLTPQKLSLFMEALQKIGYNGQVKVPTVPSGLFFRFDNLVFHGDTNEDTNRALEIAKEFFKDDLTQTQIGKDGDNPQGKWSSHSELLAEKIKMNRLAVGRQ